MKFPPKAIQSQHVHTGAPTTTLNPKNKEGKMYQKITREIGSHLTPSSSPHYFIAANFEEYKFSIFRGFFGCPRKESILDKFQNFIQSHWKLLKNAETK